MWQFWIRHVGLTDAGNVIGVTNGFIFFGVLDLLLLPVGSLIFLILSRNCDFVALQSQTFPVEADIPPSTTIS